MKGWTLQRIFCKNYYYRFLIVMQTRRKHFTAWKLWKDNSCSLPWDVCHGWNSLVDVVLLGMVDDVFSRLPLVAEHAALAVEAGQVHVHHLGVVANADLKTNSNSIQMSIILEPYSLTILGYLLNVSCVSLRPFNLYLIRFYYVLISPMR